MPGCLCSYTEIPDVVTLTRELVKINSIPGFVHKEFGKGETYLAHWLKDFLAGFDFTVDLLPVEENRPNLIARHRAFIPGLPTLAFSAHLDTVSADGMTIDPFAAEIRNDKLYGRGACDMKGTMAVMLVALLNWYEKYAFEPQAFNVLFIATMGEEGGTLGARELVKRPVPMDLVLVGEPTRLEPVIGHNGTWRFTVNTTGRSCHSSRPRLGSNAIESMMRVTGLILNEIKPEFEEIDGNAMSITKIHGGEQINIIPDACELTVDCRYRPETDVDRFKKTLIDKLTGIKEAEYHEILINPPFKAKENSLLLTRLEQALEDCRVQYERRYEPWYSDAGHFCAAGYDTVLWGVGDMAQAHTKDEYIEITQLNKGVEILQSFLYNCNKYFQKR